MPHERRHLRRLDRVFARHPVYFVTTATRDRREVLASAAVQAIFEEVWGNAEKHYRWSTGPYVIMPDHVHFFCGTSSQDAYSLGNFVGRWKEWTAKYCARRLGIESPLWQPEFFDHVLRSNESLREKKEYVWQNPVRAGLVEEAEDWEYKGNPGRWGLN